MTKNNITILSIIAGTIVIGLLIVITGGIIAAKIIREKESPSQLSKPVVEITLEVDPAFLTSIAALVTTTPSNELVEQVHVRYILTSDKTTANDVLAKLNSGASWEEMCRQYSLDKIAIQTGCDLGWFHRGVMLEGIENLAFNAPIGEFQGPEQIEYGSDQIRYGWIIIQVLGREMRPDSEGSR